MTVIAASDVDYIDPGAAYYQFTFMVTSADPVQPRGVRPGRRGGADAAARDRGADGLRRRQDDHLHDPRRRQVLAAGRTAVATAADVKYAIERSLLPGVPNGFIQTYLAGVEGIDEAIKQAQDDPTGGAPEISGITAPDDTTLEIKLTNTSSLGVIGALTLPVSRSGPGGVREGVRRREPVDLRRESGRDRSVHDRQLHAEQGDPPDSQPELGGVGRRTSGPRTWTRSRSRRASPTQCPPARRCSRAAPRSTATSRPRRA